MLILSHSYHVNTEGCQGMLVTAQAVACGCCQRTEIGSGLQPAPLPA